MDKSPTADCHLGFYQSASEINKYEGEFHDHYGRTYNNRADSAGPAVARLLACHERQSAYQRYGTRNGPAVPGSHRRSRGRWDQGADGARLPQARRCREPARILPGPNHALGPSLTRSPTWQPGV